MADRIIVLTGGIGSGKSLVARLLAQKGVTVVDADQISHGLTAPGGTAIAGIRQALGPEAISADGGLDRAVVREKVFADPSLRKALEDILHPMIQARAIEQLKASPGAYAVYVVPLWVEKYGQTAHKDQALAPGPQDPLGLKPAALVVVDCDEATQIRRVMERNGLTEQDVRSIMAAQASRQDRLRAADFVLDNNGPLDLVSAQVDALHKRLIHS